MTHPTSYALGFTTLAREERQLMLAVSGTLPGWLAGSLIRTGPARFEVGKTAYTHWFDGLAMLHAFECDSGSVRYSNRYISSDSWRDAEEQGRIARSEFMTDPCRTIFGHLWALFKPKRTDNANVNVDVLAGRVVALTETPMPIQFDPHTLKTQGHLTLDDAVKGQVSTAHPHSDGACTYSYVIQMGRKSSYRLFVDEQNHQRVIAELPVQEPSYMHSFGMSDGHLIVAEFPLCVNPLRIALSRRPFITNYRWQPERGTRLTVVDKVSGDVVARATAPPCFSFHHVNAFEENGAVHVDLVAYPDASIIERLRLDRLRAGDPPLVTGKLTRFSISLSQGMGPAFIEGALLCDTELELPRIDYKRRAGLRHSCVWGVGQSGPQAFHDTIVKVELSRERPVVRRWREDGCYPGEAVFVARPAGHAEDDGVLLSVVLDTRSRTSFLLVLDAATLSERARAVVPHHIPFGFHGNFFSADRAGPVEDASPPKGI